jgi:hypothetical protein
MIVEEFGGNRNLNDLVEFLRERWPCLRPKLQFPLSCMLPTPDNAACPLLGVRGFCGRVVHVDGGSDSSG